MWKFKRFKTFKAMEAWMLKHPNMQVVEIFVNNGYAVEYRPMRVIDIR